MANTAEPATYRGGAFFCEQHQRWECTKNRKISRGGGRCHGYSLLGLDRCRIHVGIPIALAKAQGEAMDAWSAVAGTLDLSPADAVIGMYKLAWVRAHFYAGLLEDQVAKAQEDLEAGDGDPYTRGAGPIGDGAGLVGHTFAADKEEGIYASGEAIRALTLLEGQERDRCVKYAKTAHDMGIADREIRLAEQQGQILADAVNRILAGLGLSAAQQELVPQLVPKILRAVAAGEPA